MQKANFSNSLDINNCGNIISHTLLLAKRQLAIDLIC